MWEFPNGSPPSAPAPLPTCISKMVYKFGLTSKYFIDKAHKCVSESLDRARRRVSYLRKRREKGSSKPPKLLPALRVMK